MTDMEGHDWITLHRLRFPEPVSSLERAFPPVSGPDCWLFGPHYAVGPDGMLTGVSEIWAGVGIWHSRDAAEAMVAAPGDAMPWLEESAAAWHCLTVPISHRGAVNWRGHLENGDAVRPAPADPGGPLIVLTSAGFVIMVNGSTWPFHSVEQRRYRFRFLNGCNSRFLILDFGLIPGIDVWPDPPHPRA